MSGNDCADACDCQQWGMDCLSPNLDCADSYAVRDFCTRKKPEFQCGCPKAAKRDGEAEDVPPSAPLRPTSAAHIAVTEAPWSPPLRPTSVVVSTVSSSGLSPRTDDVAAESVGHTLECNGSDMQIDTFAIVCKNGIGVLISGEWCQTWCHCDDHGRMNCDSPVTGCPESFKAVAIFCSSMSYDFSCKCAKKAKRQEIEAPSHALAGTAIDARDPGTGQQASMTCTGSDTRTRFDTGVVCMDGTTLHWSGDTCSKYCTCSGGQVHCDAPSDCGPQDELSAWCAVGPNYKFICDCTAEKRDVPVTTKKPTTTTQSKPVLSFPSTLTDLPQITPPIARAEAAAPILMVTDPITNSNVLSAATYVPSTYTPSKPKGQNTAPNPSVSVTDVTLISSTTSVDNRQTFPETMTTSRTVYFTTPCSTGGGFCERTAIDVVLVDHSTGFHATTYEAAPTSISDPSDTEHVSGYTVQCHGNDFDYGVTAADWCENNGYLWSEHCHQNCECDDEGGMTCNYTSDVCAGTAETMTSLCQAQRPEWTCVCQKQSATTQHAKRDIILTIETDPKPVQHEVSSPMSPQIGNTHNYALVCLDSKEQTQHCQSFELGYYCTDAGKVTFKGDYGDFSSCDEWCKCVDLNPKPYCFLGYTMMSSCLRKRDDGSETFTYHSRDEIEGMEQRGEAIVHRDLEALPSNMRDMIKRDATELTPSIETGIEARVPRHYSPDWAFACFGDNMLKTMRMETCPNTSNVAVYLNGYYCQAHCGCDDNGCVICDANEPTDIGECGGDDGASQFCNKKTWNEFMCGCASKITGQPGCTAVTGQVIEKRANEAQIEPVKPATTLSTITVPKESPPASALVARADFNLKCSGDDMLKTINIGDAGHCPKSTAIYLNGYYCQAHCSCNDDGCITCSTGGAPEGINECGGDDAATKFCAADHAQFGCDCYNKKGARSGCQH